MQSTLYICYSYLMYATNSWHCIYSRPCQLLTHSSFFLFSLFYNESLLKLFHINIKTKTKKRKRVEGGCAMLVNSITQITTQVRTFSWCIMVEHRKKGISLTITCLYDVCLSYIPMSLHAPIEVKERVSCLFHT